MTVGQPFRILLVGGQGIPMEDFFYYADFELGGVKKVFRSFNPSSRLPGSFMSFKGRIMRTIKYAEVGDKNV